MEAQPSTERRSTEQPSTERETYRHDSVRRLSWIFPDRETQWLRNFQNEAVWDLYAEVAADLGLEFSLVKPEDLSFDATNPRSPKAYVRGMRVTPEDTIFVTSLYSMPHQVQDVCNQVYLFTILEQLNFYLPIPPSLSYIGEEKLASVLYLADCPVPPLPTVRVGSGREAMTGHYDVAFESMKYPMIVKPAYWAMGLGVSVVHNVHDLRGVIGLAGGSDTSLVVQPYFEGVRERRVYVVDGKVHTMKQGRKDGYCVMVTKSVGGMHEREYAEFLPELDRAVQYVASRLPTPYFSVDFLFAGDELWLSEIELDGAVGLSEDEEQNRVARSLITARFEAYLRGHADRMREHAARA